MAGRPTRRPATLAMTSTLPDIDVLAVSTLGGETMGTTWSVRICASPALDLHRLHARIQRELDRIVAQMSTWRGDSDISRYNEAAAGYAQALPAEFSQVLTCALDIAGQSGGAYDPTIAPLVDAWGFGAHSAGPRIPDEATLQAAHARVDWRTLRSHFDPPQLRQPGGLRLDLSAIAKGYGVDRVAACLRDAGVPGALAEVGGELYGYGIKPDGGRWRVLVESAPDEAADDTHPPRVVILDGKAIATSGDRWHHFQQDGTRYAHTLDPRSGRPVVHAAAAVSVIADDAMRADGWATALTVMGAGEGHAFAQRHGLAARFLIRSAGGLRESMTPAFERQLAA